MAQRLKTLAASKNPPLLVNVPAQELKLIHDLDLKYRPDIDGLRAIAVIAVITFHLFPTLLPGGFAGVDMFFVISGYLISSIIFKSLQAGTFSFSDFYIRRIKRIFPTLILILTFTCLVGWMLFLKTEFVYFGKMIRSTATFTSNIFIYADVSNFESVIFNPLLHIWSLSLEEQFYIVFPIMTFFMFKIRKFLLPVLFLVFIASFTANVYFVQGHPSGVFHLLPTRAWELLMGTLLAYSVIFKYNPINVINKNILACIGLSLIIASFTLLNANQLYFAAVKSSFLFPGWLALLPTLGTTILIATSGTWINNRLLSFKPIVWTGLVSYSLYLWHWPLFSFASVYTNNKVDTISRLIILITAFVLAGLTTFYLEKPIRHSGKTTIYILVGAMISILLFSHIMSRKIINPLSLIRTSAQK